ncbi:spindle assembly checkpoint kinase [Pyrenophora tritici-repentis]|nr:spindle assembly checkpoint kinase [Pyrenophora tritici-repentis]KAF7566386.1 SPS1, Serine-threonine protein kinase [Pyrenophora tritici-repentis]KAG9379626.1 spindle assembly checkpoint kinase [Pyrenophora tritici-repentis]KAI1519339.1 spindle assembly checkpoint kinase [Pyrenophora tritici-repentis]KAI1666213.1 spindle assembly checkpoint kinase [Pyrenophora tritici-repentis]
MSDEIKYQIGFGREDNVAWGTTGLVVVDRPSKSVIKTLLHEDYSDLVLRKQQIYERFTQQGGHQGILRYYGIVGSGIRLEYAPKGNLRSFNSQNKVDDKLRLQWVVQIAQALSIVRLVGVVHGDLTCYNVFLNEKLNAKLADFVRSSLNGSPLLIAVTPSHEYPGPALSVQGDLFAFGSVLYEIMTGNVPYADLTEDEILDRYVKRDFPDTDFLRVIGEITRKCWQGQYHGFDMVVGDLSGISQSLN